MSAKRRDLKLHETTNLSLEAEEGGSENESDRSPGNEDVYERYQKAYTVVMAKQEDSEAKVLATETMLDKRLRGGEKVPVGKMRVRWTLYSPLHMDLFFTNALA